MKSYKSFIYKEVKKISKQETTSMVALSGIATNSDDPRVKLIITDLLFYNGYKKSPELTKAYEDKYGTWDQLYKSYLLNKRSFANEYKTIRNYELYSNNKESMAKFVKKIQKEFKEERVKDIAKILDVSMNVASAFKRGEINRISHFKVLEQYNTHKSKK